MKRSDIEQTDKLRLEIPYLFGTLVLVPNVDEETHNFNGSYKVCDKERGHCFGMIRLTGEHNFQTELKNTIGNHNLNGCGSLAQKKRFNTSKKIVTNKKFLNEKIIT